MAYDEFLADRIRQQLARKKNFVEKKMFGGICFIVNGNMCCGVIGQDLCIRVQPEEAASLLKKKNTRVFDFSGRPAKNMIYVEPKALQKDAQLKEWLDITMKYVKSLPPKD
jgi:hypothetical protein